MPNCCSVPKCRSNYPDSNETFTVFSLPKDPELVTKWLKQICREDVSQLATVYVCIKHFRNEDLILTFDIPQPDGIVKTVPRRPAYRPGTIPRIFDFPNYSTSNDPIPKRLDWSKKEIAFFQQGIRDSKSEHELELKNFAVTTFGDLKSKISNYCLPNSWFLWYPSDETLYIFKPLLSGSLLDVESYIIIDSSLCAKGFYDGVQL